MYIYESPNSVPNLKLNNGTLMPMLGWETCHKKAEVKQAIGDAINIGYRHFDCAHINENEKIIGHAIADKIREGVVQRDDLYIVSKLCCPLESPEVIEPSIKMTLANLRLDYLDLYLIQPVKKTENRNIDLESGKDKLDGLNCVGEFWYAMEEVSKKGLTKSVGISNFSKQQITKLLKTATVTPVTNQISEDQQELRSFCNEIGITLTIRKSSRSSFRKNLKKYDHPTIKEISKRYNKTVDQIMIRQRIHLGNAVIINSLDTAILTENFNSFNFQLSPEDVASISSLDCNASLRYVN